MIERGMADYTRGYRDEAGSEGSGRVAAMLAPVLVVVGLAAHVLFYDALPAALAWVVGSTGGLNLFAGFESPTFQRVAGLGVFLSALAAIITTESITRLARPFSVGPFLITSLAIGAALFPSLADWHRMRLGLAPEQFAVLQSYCYLALRVLVGILIGATVSWILLARPAPYVPRPQLTRK
jgi:hypothetical protein